MARILGKRKNDKHPNSRHSSDTQGGEVEKSELHVLLLNIYSHHLPQRTAETNDELGAAHALSSLAVLSLRYSKLCRL